MIRSLRRSLHALQRSLMARAAASGVTQACAASHLGCSEVRISWWTAKDARPMTLDDLLGVLELADDPAEVLRPLHDVLGLVAVPRPTSASEAVGRLEGGALALQVGLGELARTVQESVADGEIDADERARLTEQLDRLRSQIPQEIRVQIPIYRLGSLQDEVEVSYPLTLRVDVSTDGPRVAFQLSAPGLQLVLDDAASDALALLRDALGPDYLVGLGEFKLENYAF